MICKISDVAQWERFALKQNTHENDFNHKNVIATLFWLCFLYQFIVSKIFLLCRYNFDPMNDKPLPGRYEWVKLDP